MHCRRRPTFTPAFQAVIPDILPDEKDYTRALSLSRLAYDLENLVSPALAGLLLAVMSYHWLFGGTVIGFLGSAALVTASAVPAHPLSAKARPFLERLTRGTRIYLATPRLRGLLALNMAAAASGAFVIVNTVVVVRSGYGAGETEVAYALAAFGGGSMLAALLLPRLLDRLPDRMVMIAAAFLLGALTLGHAIWMFADGLLALGGFLLAWAASGTLYSAVLTPSGRLLRRSAHAEDRPAVFAAQFTLSHACWLVTYPLAGWVGEAFGLPAAMALLGMLALAASAIALLVWPAGDPEIIEHAHHELPDNHPHIANAGSDHRHAHAFVIDDEHLHWPTAY